MRKDIIYGLDLTAKIAGAVKYRSSAASSGPEAQKLNAKKHYASDYDSDQPSRRGAFPSQANIGKQIRCEYQEMHNACFIKGAICLAPLWY